MKRYVSIFKEAKKLKYKVVKDISLKQAIAQEKEGWKLVTKNMIQTDENVKKEMVKDAIIWGSSEEDYTVYDVSSKSFFKPKMNAKLPGIAIYYK